MNETIKQKQKARLDILNEIYELSGGNTDKLIDGNEIANIVSSRYDIDIIKTAVNYIKDKYLIEETNICSEPFPILKITHAGVNEIEKSLSYPDTSTEYFEAVNILRIIPQNITINNSSGIQVGGSHNVQTTTSIKNENTHLFKDIKNCISNNISNESDKKIILSKLMDLESSVDTKNYFMAYQDFISVTANYMTIISPFIPALTELAS